MSQNNTGTKTSDNPTPSSSGKEAISDSGFDMRVKISEEIDKLTNGLLYPQIVKEKIYYIVESYAASLIKERDEYREGYNDLSNIRNKLVEEKLSLTQSNEAKDKEISEYKKDLADQIESTRVVMVKNYQLTQSNEYWKQLAEAAEALINGKFLPPVRLNIEPEAKELLQKWQQLKQSKPQ